MNEINLPIKYALSPVDLGTDNVMAYIIVKCYLLEGSIICNLDGTIDSRCKVVDCKDSKLAFKDGKINLEYVREVSCVFNDIDLAKEEQRKVNELIIERLMKDKKIQDELNFREKQAGTIKSLEKIQSIRDKNFVVTPGKEKKLIYSKE